jgi:hypothetical protein
LYSLWAGGRFHEHLCGSVIEFIHIRDLKMLVSQSAAMVKDIEKVASAQCKQVLQMEEHLQSTLVDQAG